MDKKTKITLLLTVILLSSVLMINLHFSYAAKTLAVPGDYPTISQAISHASDGDTIIVQSGVYTENLAVNKSVSINGAGSKTTIIIGEGGLTGGSQPVVALNASGAEISGFTIESQNYTQTALYATGVIINADNCIIQNNIITNSYIGVFCSVQSNLQITQNTITANLKDGIRFYSGSQNTISGNTITGNAVSGIAIEGYSNTITDNVLQDNYRGIGLGTSYSTVYNNTIASDAESAVWLAGPNNILAANTISSNNWGIYITPKIGAPFNNTFYHNNFVNNVYGVYVNDSQPTEFWGSGASVGGNYWSDYTAKYPHATENTATGFYETPYQVYPNGQDNYPLTALYNADSPASVPAPKQPPKAASDGLAAYWTFDTVDANGLTPDQTGNNLAIVGSTGSTRTYTPKIVAGEVGDALSFDGQEYINVPASPSLTISGEFTVDVWVNVQAYKDIPYNNIIVEAHRTTASLPTRTFGLAINGEEPQNSSAPPVGALRGDILTADGLSEIVTTQPVVELNQWMHIVFTRSLTTGMHIYVNGVEQPVRVISGVSNPQGATIRQTETYIGHDSISTIDELKIYNTAYSPAEPLWSQWWLWAAVIFAAVAVAGLLIFAFKGRAAKKPSLK